MLRGGFKIHVFANLGFVALTVWIMRCFMQIYLRLSGMQFNWQNRLHFKLYDFKVPLKHAVGHKGIKRLIKRIKSQA